MPKQTSNRPSSVVGRTATGFVTSAAPTCHVRPRKSITPPSWTVRTASRGWYSRAGSTAGSLRPLGRYRPAGTPRPNASCDRRALYTSRQAPKLWSCALPDLRSRLLTAWQVAIGAPDDELLAALLVKQFADRQLRVDAGVVSFLVPRIERSFAAVRELVRALDRASLRARRPLTMPLARLVLGELAQRHEEQEGS